MQASPRTYAGYEQVNATISMGQSKACKSFSNRYGRNEISDGSTQRTCAIVQMPENPQQAAYVKRGAPAWCSACVAAVNSRTNAVTAVGSNAAVNFCTVANSTEK